MANAEKLLRALLGKAYKTPATEIDRLLSDDTDDDQGETQVLSFDTSRVAELQKPKPGSTFQDGYAKGKKESLTNFEKELREKFEVEDGADLTGVELVEHVMATKAKPGKGGNMTDDDVRKTPAFQKAESDFKKQLKDKDKEWQTKLEAAEQGFKKTQNFSTVSAKVLSLLNGLNPILPSSPEVAQTWKDNFVNHFKDYDFEIQEGNRIVVMKDGKVVTDQHGHSLEFDDLVKQTAPKYFEFKANNGGANGGNGKPEPGGGSGGGDNKNAYPSGINKPKTLDEYAKIVSDSSIPLKDRQVVQQVWEAEQQAGTATT